MKRWVQFSLAAAVLTTAGAALHADILVTPDGARVETKGPWKVQGRLVVFTSPSGTLSSMRTDQVDLERSKLATAQAVEAEHEQPAASAAREPAGEPILRITEKDIPPMLSPEGDESADQDSTKKTDAPSSPLEVVSWDKGVNPNGDSATIFGTIRNDGTSNIIGPSIMMAVYGVDGGLLATVDGQINQASIAPGQSANFRAEIPGLTDFTSIKFSLAGRGYEMRKPDLNNQEGTPPATTGDQDATVEETPPPIAAPTYQEEPPADSADDEPPPSR